MSAVLMKDEWLDRFYEQYIYVKNPETMPDFYLDEDHLKSIIPELIHNDKIQYHKISLIHLLKIYYINEDLKHIQKCHRDLSNQIGYLWSIIIVLIAFYIFTVF